MIRIHCSLPLVVREPITHDEARAPHLGRERVDMELTIESLDDSIMCVVLSGALDIEGAAKIEERMSAVAGETQRLITDMDNVDYLASFGIRTLITAAQTVQKQGGKMIIASPQEMVEDVLRTMVIDKIIPVYATRKEAIEALRPLI